MTWGDESPKMLQRFKEIALPEGTSTDPKDDVMRITKTVPTEKPTASASRGEQRKMGPSAGSVTVNHKLSPRHRGVVRRFFEDSKAALPVPK